MLLAEGRAVVALDEGRGCSVAPLLWPLKCPLAEWAPTEGPMEAEDEA
jgi:hypothetical protein